MPAQPTIVDLAGTTDTRAARAAVIERAGDPVPVDWAEGDGSLEAAPDRGRALRDLRAALVIVDRLEDVRHARACEPPPQLLYLADAPQDRAAALEAGADAALSASAPEEELLAQVHALLRRAMRPAVPMRDEFVATLSHELRNPLAAIRYALPVIQREGLGEASGRAVVVIHRQVDYLSRMVDDLVDVSRVLRGRISLRRERVDLRTLVTNAADAVSDTIVRGHHHLNLALPPESVWLHVDILRITQVVTHLLHNAATFTPRGGEIQVEAAVRGDRLELRVRDNGPGIPPESLSEIFDLFRQLERPHTLQGGLGIGLALSRQLTELHGGTISARSDGPGTGAEFIVQLPLVATRASPVPTPVAEAGTHAGRRLRVLIVDDNIDLVDMLTEVVSSLDHTVETAYDGRAALDRARRFHPDVVLLDLGLPGISGLEVAHQLKQQPDTAQATLVAFTGWGQAEDRTRTLAAGFDYHLTKPADLTALTDILAAIAAAE